MAKLSTGVDKDSFTNSQPRRPRLREPSSGYALALWRRDPEQNLILRVCDDTVILHSFSYGASTLGKNLSFRSPERATTHGVLRNRGRHPTGYDTIPIPPAAIQCLSAQEISWLSRQSSSPRSRSLPLKSLAQLTRRQVSTLEGGKESYRLWVGRRDRLVGRAYRRLVG